MLIWTSNCIDEIHRFVWDDCIWK